jgi:hypothetical protein
MTQNHSIESKIHLIGGEKGGVGKSMVSRLIAQYLIDSKMPFVGFDTDRSHGALLRFYAGYASSVLIDRYEALDHIIEAAVELPGRRVLVDLAAQTHQQLVQWMDDSGVLAMAQESGFSIHYWHVMDSGRDSVDLLTPVLDRFGDRIPFRLVLNQLRGNDFSTLEASGELARAQKLGGKIITIKHLHDSAAQKIDRHNSSFWSAQHSPLSETGLGMMDRQRVKMWLNHAYSELALADL